MGSTVEIFLPNDDLYSFAKAHIKGQPTYLLSASRDGIQQLLQAEEANKRGIYFLANTDDEQERFPVYVGQSGTNVANRVAQHLREKIFWTRCCSVTNVLPDFTGYHARHLEQFFIEKIKETGRAHLTNQVQHAPVALSDGDSPHVGRMIDEAKLILPMLRFDFLRDVPVPREEDILFEVVYHPKDFSGMVIEAKASEIGDDFVVLQGSQAMLEWHGQPHHYERLHKELKGDGILEPLDAHRAVFAQNFSFRKPSPAMAVIKGRAATGPKDWKVANGELRGRRYEDWKKTQV